MVDNFDANISVLKERMPWLYDRFSGIEKSGKIKVLDSRMGLPVPKVETGRGPLFVHSRFDPLKEAERFVNSLAEADYDLYIIMGLGFAYHVEYLLSLASKSSRILVIEQDPEMIVSLLESRDLSKTLGDERLLIMLRPSEDDIAEIMKGRSSRRVGFITHRGSHQLAPDYYQSMIGICRSFLSNKEVNIATLAKFEKRWASNLSRNIVSFAKGEPVSIMYDQFQDFTAVVVGAGPSLVDSLDVLKAVQDRVIIIVVDTAYGILKKSGIEPHFCLAVDPQLINARYFEGTTPGKTILVADPTVHPSVLRLFGGKILFTGVAFDLMNWIEECVGKKGEITHGGSVSTNAFDFARRLGCGRIVLIGQDLAFTGGRAHAKGSSLDEEQHLRTGRLKTVQMFNRKQLTALPPIDVKAIQGGDVRTNQKMMVFYNWFSKQADHRVYNATSAGAIIPGIPLIDINELKHMDSAADPDARILKYLNEDERYLKNEKAGSELRERVSRFCEEAKSIVPLLEKALVYSKDLLKQFSLPLAKRDAGKISYLLKKLSETDVCIESHKSVRGILSMTIQRVIHTITEGYEIDEDDSKLPEEMITAKKSVFLYEGLLEGARFSAGILERMTRIIDRDFDISA